VHEIRALGMTVDVPVLGSLRMASLALAALALLAVFRLKLGIVATLGGCAALGIAYHLVGGPI
jgi:chromate transporter